MFSKAYGATLPLQGTEIAAHWDSLYNFLLWLSLFFFVLVVGGMIYFAIRYRHSAGLKTKYITDNHLIELVWTVIPTILLMVIFGWGYSVYHEMVQAPSDAYEVKVIAKQWLWQFQYDDGRVTTGELYVPMNKPVKLIMSSEDVIHSFFVPNFRVKQDVVPGMYTSVWFEATVPGKHQVFCTEYCGTSHSEMLAKVIVLNDDQWLAWKNGKKVGPIPDAGVEVADAAAPAAPEAPAVALVSLADQGKVVAETKGCVACHTADGSPKVGPTFKGSWGHEVELSDGSKAKVDENYVRESIESPTAKIVRGFNPVMPTFKGLLSETEMNAVIAYIKSLK